MSKVKLVGLEVKGDSRGSLISIHGGKNMFDIKRVYYIFNTQEDVSRGFHAHRQLSQLLICVKGSCVIKTESFIGDKEVILDTPDKGLLIEGLVWREMHDFSEDCVLLVLASEPYDESDYIRNYDDFLRELNENV